MTTSEAYQNKEIEDKIIHAVVYNSNIVFRTECKEDAQAYLRGFNSAWIERGKEAPAFIINMRIPSNYFGRLLC